MTLTREMWVSFSNLYIYGSMGLVAALAYDEAARHKAFFPTVTALTANNLFHVALANGFFVTLYLWGWSISRLFLGKLNPPERVKVTEKFFVYFLDTVLGLGLLRMNLNYWAVVQLSVTMVFRLLHQLCAARLESLENALSIGWVGLARYVALLGSLFTVDLLLSFYYYDLARQDGFGLSLMLDLEYIVMLVLVTSVTIKLMLHQYELFRGGIWEARGELKFYCDIATEAVSCALYIAFFIIMYQHTFAPFHIIRHLVDNVTRLAKTWRDCTTYRTLIAKLARLGDPTDAELAEDRTCSVCLGDIESPIGAKRLPCKHSFHTQCLCRWLERNNTCPYCRQEIEPMLARANHPVARPANQPAAEQDPLDRALGEDVMRRVYLQYLDAHRRVAAAAAAAPQPPPLQAAGNGIAAQLAAGQDGAAPQAEPHGPEHVGNVPIRPPRVSYVTARFQVRQATALPSGPPAFATPENRSTTEIEALRKYSAAVAAASKVLEEELEAIRAAAVDEEES